MPRVSAPTSGAAVLDRIDRACTADSSDQDILEAVGVHLRRAVPADAMFLAATDPDTMLGLGAGLVQEMPDVCLPFWEHELEIPDFNKFTDLAHGPVRAADLHAVTGGRPERSPRWRMFRERTSLGAELRATFTAGGRGWGILQLNREGASRGFSEAEVALVGRVAEHVGRALRASMTTQAAADIVGRGPGMVVIDPAHRLVSATPEAAAWFSEIRSSYWITDPAYDLAVPFEVINVAQSARAAALRAEGTDTPASPTRTRLRGVNGAWLLIHASCLTEADGTPGNTAVIIEPAKASDVAPLIVEAYQLTPRELEVTRGLARGLSTNEIAGELCLSRYTVQDHLKSIYEKVGVSSRGELVARMFADHYFERLSTAVDSSPVSVL